MGIRDFLSRSRSNGSGQGSYADIPKKDVKAMTVEHGATGTSLLHGILNEEFNVKLTYPNAYDVYERMRKGDATNRAVLAALKMPIESAKHFIQPGGKTAKDKELAEFANYLVFERLGGGYKKHLKSGLTCLDFGFSLFEMVLDIEEDGPYKGHVVLDRLAPRLQKSIYKWSKYDSEEWIDGHPSHITQRLDGQTDDAPSADTIIEIPWWKTVLYAPEQEGVNYEGVSMLRSAYKHWYYKDLLYKIQSISAERFGVGIPVAKHPSGMGTQAKNKLKELVKNLKSNEQAYAVMSKDIDLDILIPKGDPKAGMIKDAIAHHDRKQYDSILAGFLNLTTGEGGSNALSKDQSSFFLRAEQALADYISDIWNCIIKYFIDLNFTNVEKYPEHKIANIAITDVEKAVNAIVAAIGSNAITWTSEDEVAVREMLGVPSRTIEEIEKDKEERQAKADEIAKGKGGDDSDEEDEGNEDEDDPDGDDNPEEEPEERKQSVKLTDTVEPTEREQKFVQNITEFEDYLELKYKECDALLTKAEAKYKSFLTGIYKKADKVERDGVMVLADTEDNKKLVKSAEKGIDLITKEMLQKEFIDSDLQEELFTVTQKAALTAILDMGVNELNDPDSFGGYDEYEYHDYGKFDGFDNYSEEQYESSYGSYVAGAILGGFVIGWVSNLLGVFYNEPRRMKENVSMNFASQVSVDLAVKQSGALTFNRNIFKLSVVTHARGLYNAMVFSAGQTVGAEHYKVLVPSSKLVQLSPHGTIAGVLFGIYTVSELNNRSNNKTGGNNTSAINGLGLHHNSFEYYMPIYEDDLESEMEISSQQRRDLDL